MRHLSILLLIALFACESGDKTDHKTLWYTFEDEVGEAIATTEIEPETNKVIATHLLEAVDLAIDPATGNLYVALGGAAEILVYAKGDLSSGKTLYTATNVIRDIAIDPANNKIYWIVANWGIVYSAKLDGSSGTGSPLFGGASTTPDCRGLAIDPLGNKLYILDYQNKRILAGDVNQNTTPVELVTPASFAMTDPHDLEISEDGNTLYWADTNRINTTETATGTSTTLIPSACTSLYMYYPTNTLYVSFSREISKAGLSPVTKFQRVFRDEQYPITKFVIR